MTDDDPGVGDLRARLGAYVATLRGSAVRHPFLDLTALDSIEARVAAVLNRWDEWSDEDRQLIRRAVDYLVETDDEEHDLLSPIGLVDDEEHLAALERRLGMA